MDIDAILNKDPKELTAEDLQAVKDALKTRAANAGEKLSEKKIDDISLADLREEIYALQRDIAGLKIPPTNAPEKKTPYQRLKNWLEN